ncbi:hypothetical protein NEOC84_002039|nr:hypothetical protein [Neochlamydia sp. AcF84]
MKNHAFGQKIHFTGLIFLDLPTYLHEMALILKQKIGFSFSIHRGRNKPLKFLEGFPSSIEACPFKRK